MTSAPIPVRGALALALAGALALSGCSGSDNKAASSGSSASGSASSSPKPYLPVPNGVKLTTPGSRLTVGEHAVVAYQVRQGKVGALDIRVTRLERTSFKKSFAGWKLDKATLRTNPYFVRAHVENVGTSDLGGRNVPLYIVDGHNTLIEASSFASTFRPCPVGQLPKKFRQGASANVCLVYLSPNHGKLTAASFRPTQQFAPITWTGTLVAPQAARAQKKTQKKSQDKTRNRAGKNAPASPTTSPKG